MRFESVTAVAFGPFTERTLRVAPGMTVVYGPNEAGKSSWQAALYAGLCGIRRSKGSPRKEDREFAERHHPWDGNGWGVTALIHLDDGRRIELRHDLDGKVDCRAVDADLGKDVSAEIMNDGSPDGACWLGLDRRSFIAVACVRQAQVMNVLEDAQVLQEQLQRAAATAGTDATAAAALARIDEFLREQVGQDRANSTKPLRRARERMESASRELEQARREHREYLQLVAASDDLADQARAAVAQHGLIQAARSVQEAAVWEQRFRDAQELAARYPTGPPDGYGADAALAEEVATALRMYDERPEIPVLHGATAAELRAALQRLPLMPDGDRVPHEHVVNAKRDLERALQALELHEHARPAEAASLVTGGLGEQELRTLATALETTVPEIDGALEQRVTAAQRQCDALPSRATQRLTIVAGVILAASGLVALERQVFTVGWLLTAAGIGGVVWAALRGSDSQRMRNVEELRAAERALGEQRHAAAAAASRLCTATEHAQQHGLSADPSALRGLADQVAERRRIQTDVERWRKRQAELLASLEGARCQLVGALEARGVATGADATTALRTYEAACVQRAVLASEAGRRANLEAQIGDREAAERAAADAAVRCQQAEDQLGAGARKCGVRGCEHTELREGLRAWQRERVAAIEEHDRHRAEWATLQALLGRGTLADLAVQTARRVEEANRQRQTFAADELAPLLSMQIDDSEVARLATRAQRAVATAADATGQVRLRATQLRSVAELEEELAAAGAELERINRLEDTLTRTSEFLKRAEERVHRDVARVLAETIKPWLPALTAHRYRDVRVNPETLQVSVCDAGGSWRNAALLSHGTAEQVYLLLRVAMAKHLAITGETCPLIFDDVTVQCDSIRKSAALDLLHAVSRERQVIVFSQEEEVLAWAQANLREPQGHVARLDNTGIDT